MLVERIEFKSCCGGIATIFKINFSISSKLLEALKAANYTESPVFTKSGILYIDNKDITATGAFGSNKLQLKCKNKNCAAAVDNLEAFIINYNE